MSKVDEDIKDLKLKAENDAINAENNILEAIQLTYQVAASVLNGCYIWAICMMVIFGLGIIGCLAFLFILLKETFK